MITTLKETKETIKFQGMQKSTYQRKQILNIPCSLEFFKTTYSFNSEDETQKKIPRKS